MNAVLRTTAMILSLGLAFALPASAQETKDPIATANAVLDHMEAGDFAATTADFNDTMKASLGATQLAGVQAQLDSAGAVQSRGEPQVGEQQGHTVVVYRIQREFAAIDATIAIDATGKVAGLHFAPATATP